MKYTYAFFVRNHNDIDHIVPVAWKLAREGEQVRFVISTHPGYQRDSRIRLLAQEPTVTINHILDFLDQGPAARMRIMREVLGDKPPNEVNFSDIWSNKLQNDSFFDRLITQLFVHAEGEHARGVACFDWTASDFVCALVRKLQRAGVASVSLPHGLRVFTNFLVAKDVFNFDKIRDNARKMSVHDYVVAPNKFKRDYYAFGIAPERIKTIGSARFCKEWREVLPCIQEEPFQAGEAARLKVAFFLRDQGYDIFWEEVQRTFLLLLQFSGVHLAVRHHPRTVGQPMLKRAYPALFGLKAPNLTIINDQSSSLPLLEWADVVLDCGTSITLEGALRNKPVLCLEYLHPNRTVMAEYVKNCDVQTRDQLYRWIELYLKGERPDFYGQELEELLAVWIDNHEQDVLGAYASFLRETARSGPVSRPAA